MIDRTFDARPSLDPRNAGYPARPLLGVTAPRPRSYTWSCYARLDQGREGSCVGHGWAHELAAKPKPVPNVTGALAVDIYRAAQHIDEWPGADYEGTSVNAGAKILRDRKLLDEWRWAASPEETVTIVGHHGPVVLGVPWLEGMRGTDPNGHVLPVGELLGWHCVILHAVRVDRGFPRASVFTGLNSWGTGWGVDGMFRLTAAGLGTLMDMGGEVCVPVVRRLPKDVR